MAVSLDRHSDKALNQTTTEGLAAEKKVIEDNLQYANSIFHNPVGKYYFVKFLQKERNQATGQFLESIETLIRKYGVEKVLGTPGQDKPTLLKEEDRFFIRDSMAIYCKNIDNDGPCTENLSAQIQSIFRQYYLQVYCGIQESEPKAATEQSSTAATSSLPTSTASSNESSGSAASALSMDSSSITSTAAPLPESDPAITRHNEALLGFYASLNTADLTFLNGRTPLGKAALEVLELLDLDTTPRFLTTQVYKDMVQDIMHRNHILAKIEKLKTTINEFIGLVDKPFSGQDGHAHASRPAKMYDSYSPAKNVLLQFDAYTQAYDDRANIKLFNSLQALKSPLEREYPSYATMSIGQVMKELIREIEDLRSLLLKGKDLVFVNQGVSKTRPGTPNSRPGTPNKNGGQEKPGVSPLRVLRQRASEDFGGHLSPSAINKMVCVLDPKVLKELPPTHPMWGNSADLPSEFAGTQPFVRQRSGSLRLVAPMVSWMYGQTASPLSSHSSGSSSPKTSDSGETSGNSSSDEESREDKKDKSAKKRLPKN